MKQLNNVEVEQVSGASILGVMSYSTIGFWVGGITGLFMGVLPAIPGALIGMTVGAYMGTDEKPTEVVHYHVYEGE